MAHWNDAVVVITGAGSGIGRALAHELDGRGARLALSDIDLERVETTAAACRRARAYHLDVADRDAVRAHADQVVADHGRVDVVVNNAGAALAADVLEQTDEDIDWLLGINLHGVISGTQAFLPHLVQTRGHVINVSSVFGIMGMPSQSIYNAAKFGVRGYTEALAIEMDLGGTGVGVHCVHPGGIATNIANFSRMAPTRDREELVETFNRVFNLARGRRTGHRPRRRPQPASHPHRCRRAHDPVRREAAGVALPAADRRRGRARAPAGGQRRGGARPCRCQGRRRRRGDARCRLTTPRLSLPDRQEQTIP